MKRVEATTWAGVFSTLICVVVGLPVLFSDASTADLPPLLWPTVFVGFIAALVTATWFGWSLPRPVTFAVFGAQVALGAAVVLLAPTAGWLPILLVFTSTLGAYLLGPALTVALVVLNTAVIALAGWFATESLMSAGMVALIYTFLQFGTVFWVRAGERETTMRRELAAAHAELRAATALRESSSRADERLRISRELHDLIGHQLTVLALELEVASHQAGPPALEHVERARGVARDLLADVRETVGELRRQTPDLVEMLTEITAELPDLDVHLDIAADDLSDEVSTTLVRCTQEVVTNTLRHADATELWISIRREGDRVTLLSEDDGSAGAPLVMGNGLRGLTERVESHGGTVTFDVDGGFRLRAEVPV
jgi:signal transduction histidine kinase